jgi:hypothetical protein
MNSQTQRRIVHDPGPRLEPEVVTPLSGPNYGAYGVVKRRWRKPLSAIVADAIANNRAVIARFKLGVTPPEGDRSHYEAIFDQLCRSTDAQIAALEAFAEIEWR